MSLTAPLRENTAGRSVSRARLSQAECCAPTRGSTTGSARFAQVLADAGSCPVGRVAVLGGTAVGKASVPQR